MHFYISYLFSLIYFSFFTASLIVDILRENLISTLILFGGRGGGKIGHATQYIMKTALEK